MEDNGKSLRELSRKKIEAVPFKADFTKAQKIASGFIKRHLNHNGLYGQVLQTLSNTDYDRLALALNSRYKVEREEVSRLSKVVERLVASDRNDFFGIYNDTRVDVSITREELAFLLGLTLANRIGGGK